MSTISTVPAVLDTLVRVITDALPDVQVVDGQPLDTDPDVITVGFTGTSGEAAVTTSRTRPQLATRPNHETVEIVCLASAWRGDTDPKAVRDRAYQLLGQVASMLANDHTLDGQVMRARISTDAFAQEQTSKGAVATVRFTITYDATTR